MRSWMVAGAGWSSDMAVIEFYFVSIQCLVAFGRKGGMRPAKVEPPVQPAMESTVRFSLPLEIVV